MWYTEKHARVRAFTREDLVFPDWLETLIRNGQVDHYRYSVPPNHLEVYELRVFDHVGAPTAMLITPEDVLLQEEGTGRLSKCLLTEFRERFFPSPYVVSVDVARSESRDESISWIALAVQSSHLEG